MPIMVVKGDGTIEPLDFGKLKRALRRSGAGQALSDEVIEYLQQEIKEKNVPAKKIYKMAFERLNEIKPGAAARFSLKNSLLKLGPDGYPFETFIGSLLKGRHYETSLRQIVPGRCISHEIDVVAKRPKMEGHPATTSIVECKFHNSPHLKCAIQSALYSWARFLDVHEKNPQIDSCWLATNTKFTSDVVQYSDCVGLKLLGWSFPQDESIQVRIDEHKLYPITVISNLSRFEFDALHSAGIILVKDLLDESDAYLAQIGIKQSRACKLKEIAKDIMSNK